MAHSWPSRVCAPCGGPARATQAASTGRAARPCVSSRARACPGARAVRGSALPTCAPVSRRARSSGSTCGPCDPSPTARSCRSPGSRSRTSLEGRAGVSVVGTPCARRAPTLGLPPGGALRHLTAVARQDHIAGDAIAPGNDRHTRPLRNEHVEAARSAGRSSIGATLVGQHDMNFVPHEDDLRTALASPSIVPGHAGPAGGCYTRGRTGVKR